MVTTFYKFLTIQSVAALKTILIYQNATSPIVFILSNEMFGKTPDPANLVSLTLDGHQSTSSLFPFYTFLFLKETLPHYYYLFSLLLF